MGVDGGGFRDVWRAPVAERWAGRRPLWWTVGPAGELAVLLVRRRQLRRHRQVRGWVGWSPRAPFDGLLLIRRADGSGERRSLDGIPLVPAHIALLPDGRLLLVAGRALRDDTTGEWRPNAVVWSTDGAHESAGCLGDDIPVLVTDRGGLVWTAHGDEGVYGGHPESAAGLAGWSTEGRSVWGPRGRLPDAPLEGCAAATEGEHVWLVWYSGGSAPGTYLTRVTPATGEVTSRPSPVPEPDGFAVRGDRAVFTRREHGRRAVEVVRARLVDGAWTVTARSRVRVPGRVVPRCGQGRDGALWLRAGDAWLSTDA
ncbi:MULTISPECIES: hypothetical protein [Streptomyces]|uniref:Glycosyl hydrolase n=2 Tax=Streptomyces TaxID=1883 RepID=A0A117IX48_9ACTN|nr:MULTISPECIES: hypothetical protein [Streptomyces]KUH39187.1 hypothetical protein ATE80_08775 [Streptomyces kanasensis]UUS33772.1 hypothetical protein NRO40_25055 [Streptomyces changanensis]